MGWYKNDPNFRKRVLELRESGLSYRGIAKELGVSYWTVWRILKEEERMSERGESANDQRYDELEAKLNKVISKLNHLLWKVELAEWMGGLRVNHKSKYLCIHVDEDGFCSYWKYRDVPKSITTREVDNGLKIIRIVEAPILCIGCPRYSPKYESVQVANQVEKEYEEKKFTRV